MSIIDKINFGHNDAKKDPHIVDYFLDEGFTTALDKKSKFIILGRKGSGKTALCRFNLTRYNTFNKVGKTLSFKNYSFVNAYKTFDRNYASPNQYQSIWKYAILVELLDTIMNREMNIPEAVAEDLSALRSFYNINFPSKSVTFQSIIDHILTHKFNLEIPVKGVSIGIERNDQKTIVKKHYLAILEDLESRLISVLDSSEYIIQFDELDEDYNDTQEYYDLLISLLKVASNLNIAFSEAGKKFRIIVYLRSDIFNSLRDHDMNKFSDDIYELNWYEEGTGINNKLRKLINRRIAYGAGLPVSYTKDLWSEIFTIHSDILNCA